MTFKEKILKQISELKGKSYTLRELENRLNLKGHSDKKILASTINDLVKEGSLSKDGKGRILLPGKDDLLKGVLQGNKRGFAFLIKEGGGDDVFIPARALNGAMHGDTVLVKLRGESEGEVISVVARGITRLVGTLIHSGKFCFVQPDNDNYFKDIFVQAEDAANIAENSKVVVSITIDKSNNKPIGKILEVIGMSGDRNTDVLSILKSYEFSDKFPEEVLKAAETIVYKEEPNRKDFRKLLTITIDGDDAKDFDDAISIEKKEDYFRLYVHIADVSHYVKGGGIIDKEALTRATSVYFPGSVFPMLPEAISNGVCSLRPDEDKLTMTAVMDIDIEGKVFHSEFYNSVIRSDFRMTYTDVTKILNGDKRLCEKYSKLIDMLSNAKELASLLEKSRNDAGAINFVTRESKITLDSKGDVVEIMPYPYDLSNNIIEQFMILANVTVAEYTFKKKMPSVYRVHEKPTEAKMQVFTKFIAGLGYSLELSRGLTPKIFSELLEQIKGEPYEAIISKIMLRSMQKAKYSTTNSGHFGLNLDFYCHFTSPIRRYPDLMVHRMLKQIISERFEEKTLARNQNFCEEAASKSSEREIAAEKSERDIDDYYKALYMTKKIGEQFDGLVSGIVNAGIFVELASTVEGFISVSLLPPDNYLFDEKNYCMLGTKYKFSIGDKVKVEIKSASTETRNVDMAFAGDENCHLRKKKTIETDLK